MVVAEPKKLHEKNKISHFLLKTEGKKNGIPSPKLIHRHFQLNGLWENALSVRGLSLCFCAGLFIWCINMFKVNRCHILVNFPSTHQKIFFLKSSFVKFVNHIVIWCLQFSQPSTTILLCLLILICF